MINKKKITIAILFQAIILEQAKSFSNRNRRLNKRWHYVKHYIEIKILQQKDTLPKVEKEFFDLEHKDLKGWDFDFSKLKNKKAILVFNSAM